MRVLVVSQYYPPEPGATQNRLLSFVTALRDAGHRVTVVCEQPNHPAGVFHEGFGHRPLMVERDGAVTVRRVWVATSPEKTTRTRLMFYATFGAGAAAVIAALPRHDVAFISSPPLPGALAAAAACRARRLPYVLDVRDIWPAAAQALGELSNERLLRLFSAGERWIYRGAVRVTTTTRPFCRHIDAVAGRPIATFLPNGALDELVAADPSDPPGDGPLRIGYAGNFGIAQGLGIVTDAAALLRDEPIEFVLVGDGPVRAQLEAAKQRDELDNLELRKSVPVSEVGAFLRTCHALLVPLSRQEMLGDFVPSKLYDAMAVGRPAIVACRGEAAALTEEHGCGIVVEPEDGAGLARAARRLAGDPGLREQLATAGRRAAPTYARSRQAENLVELLASVAGGR